MPFWGADRRPPHRTLTPPEAVVHRNTIRHSSGDGSSDTARPRTRDKRAAPGGGNISDGALRLGPARPARFNLIGVLGQSDVVHTRSPRDPTSGQARSLSEHAIAESVFARVRMEEAFVPAL